jgi:hypothetical protein
MEEVLELVLDGGVPVLGVVRRRPEILDNVGAASSSEIK